MHEMSIAMAVVGQVEDAATAAGAPGVETVVLRVGELAGVVPDALRFCYELACADTVLAGSTLEVETVPGRAACARRHEWAVGMPPDLTCPHCDSSEVELLAGRELQVARAQWREPVPAQPVPITSEEQ